MHENEIFPKRFAGMDFDEGSTDTTNPELEKLLTQLRDILEE